MSDYITWLRSRIGPRKTLLAYATALIRDDAGQLLFQRRRDFRDAWWGLPGGVLEIGESFVDCAKREALEETGYHVEPTRLVGLYCSPEWDVRYPNGDEVQQFTVALECHIVGGQSQPDGAETTANRFFAPDAWPAHTSPWYAAMARDLLCTNGAYFDPPVIGDSVNSYMPGLRSLVGTAPLIVAGAGALIFDDNGRVLLGLRGDNHLWGMPAGQMELGETPAGTVVREAYEEVGLHIRPTQLSSVLTDAVLHTYPDGNQVQVAGARFLAEVIGGELKPDGYETLDAQWFEVNDLPPMVPRHLRALHMALAHPEGGQFC
ncbi:MAG TPA: NUDIX domain-containing protein [Anaerolineae bacterium]|nr:NUDIX domain-containing protein [Anaerolineae bacterium]